MSKENKHISKLLKNIALGLQKYEIEELNEALVLLLSKKTDQKAEVDYVLKLVSELHEITPNSLITSRGRGNIQQARKLAYCLLHYTLGLSIRQIGSLFSRYHNSVTSALKEYKAHQPKKFKEDEIFERNLVRSKERLFEYINSKS
tara:strand:- start:7397 stop:7834 length:438 start_codon:yes stop_codon:yes gene_type:complete